METDTAAVAETTPMETIGQRSMETIDQVRAAEAKAFEREAVAAIEFYSFPYWRLTPKRPLYGFPYFATSRRDARQLLVAQGRVS